MATKRKYELDRPELSDDQILKHKNFDELMKAYGKASNPFYRTFKFWGYTAVVSIAVVSGVYVLNTMGNNEVAGTPQNTVEIIEQTPAFLEEEGVELFQLQDEEQSFTSKFGTMFSLSRKDLDGLQEGPVTIAIKEMKGIASAHLAGVKPNLAEGSNLHSFGLEIRAYQNNKELNLAADNNIEISMVSAVGEEGEMFAMKENGSDMTPMGSLDLVWTPTQIEEVADVEPVIKNLTLVKPKQRNNSKPRFPNMNFDQNRFPEIVMMDKAVFEVDESYVKYEGVSEADGFELSRHSKKGLYNFKFIFEDTAITYVVYPVYPKAAMKAAMNRYKVETGGLSEAPKEVITEDNATASADQQMALQKAEAAGVEPAGVVKARVSNFGTFWCHFSAKPLKGKVFGSNFFSNNTRLKPQKVYLANLETMSIHDITGKRPKIQTKYDHVLWVVLSEDEMGICPISKMKELAEVKSEDREVHQFQMDVYNRREGMAKLQRLFGEPTPGGTAL